MVLKLLLSSFIAFALLLLVVVDGGAPPTTKATSRNIKILNQSGGRIEVHWIHPQTRQATEMSNPGGVMNGADFPLNSFIGHEFEIRQVPNKNTGACDNEDKVCLRKIFAVTENSEQVMTIGRGLEFDFVDDQIKARKEAGSLVNECKVKAKARLDAANGNSAETMAAMDDLVACVESGVADTLSRANEEINFQAKVRRGMGEQMENYTCADLALDSSEPVDTEYWRGMSVAKMLERPASKIHVIENFISPKECEAMEAAAKPKLHRATVADGKGGSHFSEHRKAMQAGIKVNWGAEESGDHIAALSRRVYDYVEHVLALGIDERGQEDLMSIQYFGRGLNDTAPDRYTPHCDGDCTGLPHKTGTRMATVVMYCTIPEVGGHTNFRNANVHVKPKTGNAIFFSYIDPKTKLTDNGFTEHSGCPVLEGEKKIVTQWVRYGVDEQNPWYSFNTLGVRKGGE